MRKLIDLSGMTFGRLKVIKRHFSNTKSGKPQYECVCSCAEGKTLVVRGSHLTTGNTKSCGCLNREAISTHGLSLSTEYRIWKGIKQRCYLETDNDYPEYGGRGITMSDDWRDSFETFYKDMGPRPSLQHSIDRRENDKGYSKENCRWATWEEQNNNRRDNLFYEHDGVSRTLAAWCRELGLKYTTVRYRLSIGMSFGQAIGAIILEEKK